VGVGPHAREKSPREVRDGSPAHTPGVRAPDARAVCRSRGAGRRRLAAVVRTIVPAVRPVVGGAPETGCPGGRTRRVHRAQHARAARIVLRGASDRRGPRADQLSTDARRLRVHRHALGIDNRVRTRGLPRSGRSRTGSARGRPSFRRARGPADPPRSYGRRLRRAISSRSTTRAARPHVRKA
jgi:hypothetical protein